MNFNLQQSVFLVAECRHLSADLQHKFQLLRIFCLCLAQTLQLVDSKLNVVRSSCRCVWSKTPLSVGERGSKSVQFGARVTTNAVVKELDSAAFRRKNAAVGSGEVFVRCFERPSRTGLLDPGLGNLASCCGRPQLAHRGTHSPCHAIFWASRTDCEQMLGHRHVGVAHRMIQLCASQPLQPQPCRSHARMDSRDLTGRSCRAK